RGSSCRIMLLRMVDFPAPLGPMRVMISPRRTWRAMCSMRAFPRYPTARSWVRRMASDMGTPPSPDHDDDDHRSAEDGRHGADGELRGGEGRPGDHVAEQAEHRAPQEAG